MNNKLQIFMSYKRMYEPFVSEVSRRLREEGYDVWQDVEGKSSGIPHSVKWFDVIENALYSAGGAVIFKTPEWEESVVCIKENELIRALELPFTEVSKESIEENAVDETVEHIKAWYHWEVNKRENAARARLFTGVRQFIRDPKSHRFPRGRDLDSMYDAASENNYFRSIPASYEELMETKGPDIIKEKTFGAYVERYIDKAMIRRIARKAAIGGLLVLVAAALAVGGVSYFIVRHNANLNQRQAERSALIREISMMAEHAPVEAMIDLSDSSVFSLAESFFIRSLLMLDYRGRRYPAIMYEAGSGEALMYARTPALERSELFAAVPSPVSGALRVESADGTRTTQIVFDAAVDDFAWNDDGGLLAVCAGGAVYVYDAALRGEPFRLWEPFSQSNFISVLWEEISVVGITDTGKAVIWDYVNPRARQDKELRSGEIFLWNNAPCAVYVYDNELYVQAANYAEALHLGVEGELSDTFIAVSDDGSLAAVKYTDESGGENLLTVDLSGISIVSREPLTFDFSELRPLRAYALSRPIMGFAFAPDGRSIAAALWDYGGIMSLELESGEETLSPSDWLPCFSVTPYLTENGYEWAVGTYLGTIRRYDADLKPIGEPMPANLMGEMPRRIAVSEKFGYAYTSNFGGNNILANSRLDLNTGQETMFPLPIDNAVVSTTAVAVSADGDYVAFGYPHGKILVWDAASMNLIRTGHDIRESIIDMRFNDDNSSLIILLESGTMLLYRISDIGELYPTRGALGLLSFLGEMRREAVRLYQMYSGMR